MTSLLHPDFAFEDAACGIVCGVDEVGRGPLAGPVVAAAVVLRRNIMPEDILNTIQDSKKLTAKKRSILSEQIHEYAHVSIAECSVADIDRINILQAALLAMKNAVETLDIKPDTALIDGNKAPELDCTTHTIIKGDNRSLSIAAASIVAKHYRDQLMIQYAEEYPHYGWERNAGYGTAQHIAALDTHGITPLHRRSFSPVAQRLKKIRA